MADHIDFYQDFFDAPEDFAYKCLNLTGGKMPVLDDPIFNKRNSRYLSTIPDIMSEDFMEKIYALERMTRCRENDVKLRFIFSSLFFFLKMELSDKEKRIAIDMLSTCIRKL